jgi:hypothetical protein
VPPTTGRLEEGVCDGVDCGPGGKCRATNQTLDSVGLACDCPVGSSATWLVHKEPEHSGQPSCKPNLCTSTMWSHIADDDPVVSHTVRWAGLLKYHPCQIRMRKGAAEFVCTIRCGYG